MRLQLTSDGDVIEISCTVDSGSPQVADGDDSEREWSLRILDVLVDEHGRDSSGDGYRAWLRKRRARSNV